MGALDKTIESVKRRLQQGSAIDASPVHLRAATLSKRTLIAIEGSEAIEFANDLTTNNLARQSSENSQEGGAQATAFLTAQGTLQQLCLAVRTPHGLLLECDRARLHAFAETLWKARLGRAVSFRWLKEMQVIGLFPENTLPENTLSENTLPENMLPENMLKEQSLAGASKVVVLAGKQQEKNAQQDEAAEYLFVDPRTPLAAMRLWHNDAEDALQTLALPWAEEEAYEAHRLALGIVERAEEWEGVAKKYALPFAFGLDALGVMDWQKDCYVGQETAARLKYRARAPKKHALPICVQDNENAVRAGDSVFVETKEQSETLCGEVLYRVADEQKTILLVFFNLASLREKTPLSAGEKLVVVCASGERLQGELLLPRWLAEVLQKPA